MLRLNLINVRSTCRPLACSFRESTSNAGKQQFPGLSPSANSTAPDWYESLLIDHKIASKESIDNFNNMFELQKYRLIGSEELERLKIALDLKRVILENEKNILREVRKASLDAKQKLTHCKNIIKFYKEGRGLYNSEQNSSLQIKKEDYIAAISDELDLEIADDNAYKRLLEQQSKVEEIQDQFDNLAFLKYDENSKIERNSQVRALIILLLSPLVQFLMFRYLEPIKRTSQLKPVQEELTAEISRLTENINTLSQTVLALQSSASAVQSVVPTAVPPVTTTSECTPHNSHTNNSSNGDSGESQAGQAEQSTQTDSSLAATALIANSKPEVNTTNTSEYSDDSAQSANATAVTAATAVAAAAAAAAAGNSNLTSVGDSTRRATHSNSVDNTTSRFSVVNIASEQLDRWLSTYISDDEKTRSAFCGSFMFCSTALMWIVATSLSH